MRACIHSFEWDYDWNPMYDISEIPDSILGVHNEVEIDPDVFKRITACLDEFEKCQKIMYDMVHSK
jgi:hypothetical protein